LEKAYESGKRVKVKVGNAERVEFLNSLLWIYEESSFLPHGVKKEGNADLQPIYLSADDDNPNSAVFLFLVDGARVGLVEDMAGFERVFDIFDGNLPEAVVQAREFWKALKDTEWDLAYWQQDAFGSWVKKG
jgi:DNA polymerase-3 subunit chi